MEHKSGEKRYWIIEKNEQERTNGRRVGLRGWKMAYGEKDGGGLCVCVCVHEAEEEEQEGGWSWWGVEVRATQWHSVNCGLMKVLIMELVTFQPVTEPVSLIDPLWSVTRRHYWSVPRSCSTTPTCIHKQRPSPGRRRTAPQAEIPSAPPAEGPRVSSHKERPIDRTKDDIVDGGTKPQNRLPLNQANVDIGWWIAILV